VLEAEEDDLAVKLDRLRQAVGACAAIIEGGTGLEVRKEHGYGFPCWKRKSR